MYACIWLTSRYSSVIFQNACQREIKKNVFPISLPRASGSFRFSEAIDVVDLICLRSCRPPHKL